MSCQSKISGVVYGVFHIFRNFPGAFHVSGIFPEFFKFRKKVWNETSEIRKFRTCSGVAATLKRLHCFSPVYSCGVSALYIHTPAPKWHVRVYCQSMLSVKAGWSLYPPIANSMSAENSSRGLRWTAGKAPHPKTNWREGWGVNIYTHLGLIKELISP